LSHCQNSVKTPVRANKSSIEIGIWHRGPRRPAETAITPGWSLRWGQFVATLGAGIWTTALPLRLCWRPSGPSPSYATPTGPPGLRRPIARGVAGGRRPRGRRTRCGG